MLVEAFEDWFMNQSIVEIFKTWELIFWHSYFYLNDSERLLLVKHHASDREFSTSFYHRYAFSNSALLLKVLPYQYLVDILMGRHYLLGPKIYPVLKCSLFINGILLHHLILNLQVTFLRRKFSFMIVTLRVSYYFLWLKYPFEDRVSTLFIELASLNTALEVLLPPEILLC